MADKWRTWKVFEHNGKELFAYTLFGEGEDEKEATIALLAYENHCRPETIFYKGIMPSEVDFRFSSG